MQEDAPRTLAQHPDIVSRPIGDELVAYHPESQQAYLLTPQAAQVYRDVESLTASDLESAQGTELEEVLSELVQHKLVLPENELTRRRFLGSVGKVAAAGVFLTTVALPTPAAAQSGAMTISFTTAGTFSQVVPAGVTSVSITLVGGDGGMGGNVVPGFPNPSDGARGQSSSGSFTVTPGETLAITVGAHGLNGSPNSVATGGAGGAGGSGNPNGANGQPGQTSTTNGGAGGGGAGGTTSVSGMAFSASAQGGTGGGGQAAGGTGGSPGTAGGAGETTAVVGQGNGGNGGVAAVGTGNGSGADGSVMLTFS